MTAAWLPPGKQTFVDENGVPLEGGKVWHYIPGTSTLKDTWQDYDQVSLNTNPVVLDERGQCMIFGTGSYRQRLTDADDVEIWDRDTTVGFQADVVLAGGAIFGLRYAPNTGNPTTQIDITLGQCRDSTNTTDIVLPAGLTKSMTAVWAAGTGNGGRDSATALAALQSYHVFVIMNPSSGAVDCLFSQSPTAPNLPAGYTLFRRIGALPRLGASVSPPSGTGIPFFTQTGGGNQILLANPNNEFTGQTGSTAALLRELLVPLGIITSPIMYMQLTNTPAGTVVLLRITDPALGTPPAFGGTDQFGQLRLATDQTYITTMVTEPANTSAQVYLQCSVAAAVWALKSRGWWDYRDQL